MSYIGKTESCYIQHRRRMGEHMASQSRTRLSQQQQDNNVKKLASRPGLHSGNVQRQNIAHSVIQLIAMLSSIRNSNVIDGMRESRYARGKNECAIAHTGKFVPNFIQNTTITVQQENSTFIRNSVKKEMSNPEMLLQTRCDSTELTKIILCFLDGLTTFLSPVIIVLNEANHLFCKYDTLKFPGAAEEEIGIEIRPPAMSEVKRQADGELFGSNSAGKTSIAFDPSNAIVGDGNPKVLQKAPWSKQAPTVGLYHEMLHTYYTHHPHAFVSADGITKKKVGGGSTLIEEARIVGTRYYEKQKACLFDFSDNSYLTTNRADRFTENSFRREYAKLNKAAYYHIRPVYGDGTNQIPLNQHFLSIK